MASVLLRLLEPSGSLHPCPDSFIGADGIFTLPIGVQSHRETRQARVQILHIADGVAADSVGLSPPVFRLEGTFGSRTKTIKGRTLEAGEVDDDFYAFVSYFFTKRREKLRERKPMIEMAYDDFVHNRHWIVMPAGAPEYSHGSRELRQSWTLVLNAVRPASSAKNATTDPTKTAVEPPNRSALAGTLKSRAEK